MDVSAVWKPGPPSSWQNSVSGVMSKSASGGSPEVQVRGAVVFPPFCLWTHVFYLRGTQHHVVGHRFSMCTTVEDSVLCPLRASSKVMLQLHPPQNDGFYRPALQVGAACAGRSGCYGRWVPPLILCYRVYYFNSKIPFKCWPISFLSSDIYHNYMYFETG